jgi:hypothetical protein
MVRSGWFRDNFRHSLAARGLTRRYSYDAIALRPGSDMGYTGFPSLYRMDQFNAPVSRTELIANWRKGRRPTEYVYDEKTGKMKSVDHILAAYGVKKNKEKAPQVKGTAIIGGQLYTSAAEMESRPEYDIEAALEAAQAQEMQMTNVPGITADAMPTVSEPGMQEGLTLPVEQQAQRVDGGPPMEGSSSLYTSAPASMTPQVTKKGWTETPLSTVDVFEPTPMDEDRH